MKKVSQVEKRLSAESGAWSRDTLLTRVTGTALLALVLSVPGIATAQQSSCAWSRDVKLVNGKILTMDAKNSIVSEVTIQDGKFTAIGKVANEKLNACTKVIDLKSRTVVPGLIDNHDHFIALGLRPGYDVRLETAWSIADIQALIRKRVATAPSGAFITATAGWGIHQLAEKRMPTLAELDAAAPRNPVFISPTGAGGGMTNSLGKRFFESKGVKVDASGALTTAGGPGGGGDTIAALRTAQTFEDEKRGLMDAEAYSVSLGLTTNVDQGFNYLAGSPDLQDSAVGGPGLETFNPWTVYNSTLALDRENKLTARIRIFQYTVDTNMEIPILRERLRNTFPLFGDDMFKISGVGERVVSLPPLPPGAPRGNDRRMRENEEVALQFVAKQGWTYSEHSLQLATDKEITGVFEKVNAVTPIADLHWSVAHVYHIDKDTVDRLKSMGAGLEVHTSSYMKDASTAGTPPAAGPPLRMILDSGIHAGGGSDGVAVTALNPWLGIYYMVSGRNLAGEMVNDGQQITRMEALRLYTADNGWFFGEQDSLGSMEPGKLGDLAVLSADYADPKKVPDAEIRNLKSVFTVVGGKVVYDQLH
ncbi:MAG TPA: amidohydrolase family protein [Terriglobales bacterium]|nr:amidohydrolase family protein [Terriglobales bacterium]